jgi:CSLREA domain-containing protein
MKVKRHIRGLLAQLLSAPQRWRRALAMVTFFVIVASGFALARTSAGERFASFTWPESLSSIFGNRSPRTRTPIMPAGPTYTWTQPAQNISGTLFDSAGFPIITTRTIKLLQNGTSFGTTTTNGSGDYSFTGLTLASGDKIAVYISGAPEKGATITLSGAADITNLNIRQNVLIVRTDNGGAITNANLREAEGGFADPDLTAVRMVDPTNVLIVPASFTLEIWTGSTYAPGADINIGGNWTNNGIFVPGSSTVTCNGNLNQTIAGSSSTTFNALTISNTGTSPDNVVSLDGSAGATNTVVSLLTITGGVFDQGTDLASSNLIMDGFSRCVDMGPNGTWRNRGRGDETLSCDVFNEGTIIFNSLGTPCGEDDEILIRSSETGTQRTWEGPGTFSMIDVDVQDQRVPGGVTLPLQILVNSGTNSLNNTGWTFLNTCTGPYTWIGGVGQKWADEVNWSPIRTTAKDASTTDELIFDGNVTPAAVVEDVQDQTNAAIRLKNGALVTLKSNVGGATLTLDGDTGTDLDVPAGTLLTFAGSRPLTIELTASGHECEVAGRVIMQDEAHQLIGANAGEITMTGADAFTTTTGFNGHPFGSGTNGSVVFQSGSTGSFNSGLDPFGGTGHSVVTFNAGSTAHFRAATAFFGDGGTYGNLILDGTDQSYFLAGSNQTTILNNFTLGIGNTFVLSSTPGADINLFGNFRDETVLANGFQANGRTLIFQGATQTIFKTASIASFSDVSIAQIPGGKVQLLSPTRINGQLNLTTSDALLELNGQSLELLGTITGPGNLKGDLSASIVVGGIGAFGTVNFVSGGRTLSSLQLNRGSNGSMTLGTDLALSGNLLLSNGILNTGANTLSLSSASAPLRTNGYVIGNLQKSFGISGNLGSFTFPLGTANAYSPLDANVTANTNGTLTAKAVQGKQPNISGANALQRYWTLSGSGITADLTFHYSTSPTNDVVGNEANYKIFKYDGSFTQFTPDATGSVSASDHFATLNNVSSFSDWTLAELAVVNPGTVAFVGAPYTATEGAADHDVTITVARSGGTDGALDVTYATSPGTATAGTDYIETTGTLHWDNGETGDKTFLITVKGDTTYEANETVMITLSDATDGATIGGPNPTTLTITNDDNPAATLTVNTLDDNDFGACFPSLGHCSLREAVNAANFSGDVSAIVFEPGLTGTITVGSELRLETPMNINGPGASVITVSGNSDASPAFHLISSGVTLSDLTIADANSAIVVASTGSGTVTNIYFLNNDAPGGGGAIAVASSGAISVDRCTFFNNTGNGGGAISNGDGTVVISNSTISGNGALAFSGGGISQNGSGSVTIVNTTITGNTAGASGGGIRVFSGTVNIRNTIVAGNSATTSGPDVFGAFISNGHNLIGNSDGSSGFGASGDQVGTGAAPINPLLGPLQNNGGLTFTHALLSGSPAIDAGDDCVTLASGSGGCLVTPLMTDQRGTGFDRKVDGNSDGVTTVDIGAYEAAACTTPPATPTITPQGPTTFCEAGSVTLTSSSAGGNQWYKDNVLLSGDTNQNYIASTSGNYTVTVTENGCTSAPSTATTVTVNPTPATPTASNGGPYCEGATISLSTPTVAGATYSWTGPGGFTSADQNPTRANATTADGGTYSVTITVNGCTSAAGTTNVVVNATPATPTASNGGPYCEGATISLSTPAVAGATHSWTGPNGFTSSDQNPTRANATTADAGVYSVTITVNGCTSAAGTTNVVVNATPATPTASNGGPYCEGATISLSTPAVAGATYSWIGPNGFTSSDQNPTRANATTADAGTYSVTITVNGCTSAAGTTNVVVNATPATPTASNGGPYFEGATISLSTPTVAGATYSWSGPNGFTSSDQNPTRANATIADAGTYSVTITVNGCPSAGGTTNVVVTPTVSAGDGQTAEPASGTSQLLFTIALSAPAPAAGASVDYATAAGGANPATAGPVCGGSVDYQTTNGTVNFAPGEQIKTVAVPVCADGTSEPDETLLLNLSSPTGVTISDGQATGTITTANQAGTFLISELRTSGAGGVGDDFVELYNNTDSPLTVPAGGYGLFKMGTDCTAAPILIGTVAAGTTIPARGHYLFASSQYSLADYGGTGAAAADATLTSDIESDGNVALFSAADVANISSANRLDAVGFGTNVSDNCALLKEGTNLTAVAGSNTEHSFFRKLCDFVAGVGCTTPGTPKDTNDNATDFMFADTQGTFISGGPPQRLGAPGPENLASPILRNNMAVTMLDNTKSQAVAPNRVRDMTSNPGNNSTFGTLSMRRRVVNNTGVNVTRLRFRLVEMTTFPSPGSGVADLRAITSSNVSVSAINDSGTCFAGTGSTTTPCTVTVLGTTLEQPPNQPNGGGVNSTLADGSITLGAPLAPGASTMVQFMLGVQTTGTFRFLIIVEALP